MNMMKVANFLGKVDLYAVHGVDHAEVVEDYVNHISFLCEAEAPASSGKGSGVGGFSHLECGDEGNMDEGELVSGGELMGTNDGLKVEVDIEGEVEVDIEGGVKLEISGRKEVEQIVGEEVDGGVEVDKYGGVQEEVVVESEDGVDNLEEVEVENKTP
ncbi:hypothetical protein LR48_Vigan04g068100 [Vigna angularis]|uniref:Uncharacterized protein n=1 Tax=Phaseolus angularis TaxID=3914 RepID=A0A0L9UCL6_PHAAN|nr:hypothetical protein LR48_Vigan04g068100 [Vigna angularis]